MKHLFYAAIWSVTTGICLYQFITNPDHQMTFIAGYGVICGGVLMGWEIKGFIKQRKERE